MTTRVKVCCISSEEEALAAIEAGAHTIGLVSHMPSGPGVIEESLIARIIEALDKPLWLAGGLRAENITRAIDQVAPWGLDLCSGVRTDGALDVEKLREFMHVVSKCRSS